MTSVNCSKIHCILWAFPHVGRHRWSTLITNMFSIVGEGLQEVPSHYVNAQGNLGSEVGTGQNQDTKTDLYKILENANLLSYYEAFMEIGADDITQLFDTCGDDFVEAIEVSGMALKPLHVRRLERALNDWQHEQGKIKDSYWTLQQM